MTASLHLHFSPFSTIVLYYFYRLCIAFVLLASYKKQWNYKYVENSKAAYTAYT